MPIGKSDTRGARSGLADTDAMPAERLSRWAGIGIIAGAAGTISALVGAWRLR